MCWGLRDGEDVVFLNRLLRSLEAFCKKYPFQRKVLIMPSYQAGNELKEELARHAGGFMNLRTETVYGLAEKAAAVKIARIRPILLSSSEAAFIFENVYRCLERNGYLTYFSKKGASDSLVSAIAAAILELRSLRITAKSIDATGFLNPEKGRDIKKLFRNYERYTRWSKLYRPPILFERSHESARRSRRCLLPHAAISQPEPHGERIYKQLDTQGAAFCSAGRNDSWHHATIRHSSYALAEQSG